MVGNAKLELVYNKIKNRVLSSNYFSVFIDKIINNDKLALAIGNIDEEDISTRLADSFKDLDFVYELACRLGMEGDFISMVLSSVKDDNVIKSVIMTKLMEYYYGNPLKEDLDIYDELLYILQTIFSSDVLIESIESDDVLYNEFCNMMKTSNKDEYNSFINAFSSLYEIIKDEKDYERIIEKINENSDTLYSYVKDGLREKKVALNSDDYELLLSRLPHNLTVNIQKNM